MQNTSVFLNSVHVGDLVFPGPPTPPVARSLDLPGALLMSDAINEIRFDIPGATFPDTGDARLVGLALTSLRLDQVETD